MNPSHHHAVQLTLTLALLAPACRADDAQPKLDTITLTLKEGKSFTLEVADTEKKRSAGLMHRTTMPADHGMLFIFAKADNHAFWMKNTKIPLDLIFLDDAGKVVSIHTLKPDDETPVPPDKPARYAIELNAGTAKTIGLKTGDTVTLPEKVLKPAKPSDDKS
jgi:uncharacterized membrane protein (UPF0127 family)